MSVQDFDELDIIGKTPSYEKYFDEMEIPDEEKQQRIKLAKKFESMFFSLFLMLLDENKDIENCYKIADEEYCKIARKFLNTKRTLRIEIKNKQKYCRLVCNTEERG